MAATKSVRIPENEFDIAKKHAEKVQKTLAQVIANAIRRCYGKADA
jgi:hypothetical protein